jgi:DNA-binding NtrC family response regulator
VADIIVVDDDQSVATAFERFLAYEGHTCRLASSAADAFALIEQRLPAVVIMDIRMPGVDGLTALQQLRARFPDISVVMMTAYGTSQTSIEAIRSGAFDYLTKPPDLDELREVIAKALESRRAGPPQGEADAAALEAGVNLIGTTPAMLEIYKMIGRFATNNVPALIVGERGTGKHLVAATIHEHSARADKPYVSIRCAMVAGAELNSRLFEASAGTIELVDVRRLPEALQDDVAQALGAARTRGAALPATARVLATSERDLADEVRAGAFSRELYEELAVITLRLPPLRERREDIPPLVAHFLQRFNVELERAVRAVDEQVMRRFHAHAWPGNVGELERVLRRACIVARSDVVTMDDLGESLSEGQFASRADAESGLERAAIAAMHDRLVQAGGSDASVFHDIVDAVESALVREALSMTGGNQVKAADLLGVNRATLRKKMLAEE